MRPFGGEAIGRPVRIAVLAGVVLMAGAAAADRAVAQSQSGFPGGTWQHDCFKASLDGFYLHAQCRSQAGSLVDALYDVRTCPTQTLVNNGGQLTCAPQKQTGIPANSNVLPSGEWRWYCSDGYVDPNRVLHARCLNDSGQRVVTSISSQSCQGNPLVGVVNGRLNCDNRQNGNSQFADIAIQGNWRLVCRDAFFDSAKNLYALCQDDNWRWRPSRLYMPSCPSLAGPVSTNNGQLRCP